MASGAAVLVLFSAVVDQQLSVPSLFCIVLLYVAVLLPSSVVVDSWLPALALFYIVLLHVAVLLPSSVVSVVDCWALLFCVPVVLFYSVFLAEFFRVFVFHVSSAALAVHC